MKKLLIILLLGLFSCTENQKAKHYGGTSEIVLDKGDKLINITWKDANLWYLTKKMLATDSAEIYYFQEKSDYGV